jgi:hypothetical protein
MIAPVLRTPDNAPHNGPCIFQLICHEINKEMPTHRRNTIGIIVRHYYDGRQLFLDAKPSELALQQ